MVVARLGVLIHEPQLPKESAVDWEDFIPRGGEAIRSEVELLDLIDVDDRFDERLAGGKRLKLRSNLGQL
jgi:hypothetical protein